MITIHDGNYHYSEDIGIHDINLHINKGETDVIAQVILSY